MQKIFITLSFIFLVGCIYWLVDFRLTTSEEYLLTVDRGKSLKTINEENLAKKLPNNRILDTDDSANSNDQRQRINSEGSESLNSLAASNVGELQKKKDNVSITQDLFIENRNKPNQEIQDQNYSAVIKEICFKNEKGDMLFGGKKIELIEGVNLVSNELAVEFSKDKNNEWLIRVDSELYFLYEAQYSSDIKKAFPLSTFLHNGSDEVTLSLYSIIEIKLNYINRPKQVLNTYSCTLSDNDFFYVNGEISNNIAILKSSITGEIKLSRLTSSWFKTSFQKEINLKRGEKVSFDLDIKMNNEQTFIIVDSQLKPLENYYVFCSKNSFGRALALDDFRSTLAFNGLVKKSNNIAITDNNGFGKFLNLSDGDYLFYIIGKNHNEQVFQVKVEESRKKIEITLKDDIPKSLILYTKKDKQPFLNEIKFTYYDMNLYNSVTKKYKGKIINGQIEIKILTPSKYQFQLDSNDFNREIVEFDFTENNHIAYTFDLEISDKYIHGYIKNTKGEPLKNISIDIISGDFRIKVKSQDDGYFKIGGLEKTKGYYLKIDSYNIVNSIGDEILYPSTVHQNIIIQDNLNLSGKVLDINGMPAKIFSIFIKYSNDKDFINSTISTGESLLNGEFKIDGMKYGYYKIKIFSPNSAIFQKQLSILTPEENVPLTLQLEEGFPVNLFVVDCENKPVEGATIFRESTKRISEVGESIGSLVTDESGRIKINNCLENETYTVLKNGYTPTTFVIHNKTNNSTINVSFPKSYKIKGVLYDIKKNPMQFIKFVGYSKSDPEYQITGSTNINGAFFINAITPGEWHISFNVVVPYGGSKPSKWITVIDRDLDVDINLDDLTNKF